jgi:translocator protein
MTNTITFIVCILICEGAGAIGGFFTSRSVAEWYPTLIKPSFTPPSWLFMPVWTLLYLLMGISAFLIWRIGWQSNVVKIALAVFIIQLALNVAWSAVFFGMKSTIGGMIVIFLLWLAILFTIILFFRLSKISAVLLIPYNLWVSFASVLNVALVYLNLPKK